MREAQNARSTTMKINPGTDESIQFICPRIRCTDIKVLSIQEVLCARGTRVTSVVERLDFSFSLNITSYRRKLRGKHPKRGIFWSENGLRSDPSKVDEYLQV